jgi:hypothetical protein
MEGNAKPYHTRHIHIHIVLLLLLLMTLNWMNGWGMGMEMGMVVSVECWPSLLLLLLPFCTSLLQKKIFLAIFFFGSSSFLHFEINWIYFASPIPRAWYIFQISHYFVCCRKQPATSRGQPHGRGTQNWYDFGIGWKFMRRRKGKWRRRSKKRTKLKAEWLFTIWQHAIN